jgi:hypothetical protein
MSSEMSAEEFRRLMVARIETRLLSTDWEDPQSSSDDVSFFSSVLEEHKDLFSFDDGPLPRKSRGIFTARGFGGYGGCTLATSFEDQEWPYFMIYVTEAGEDDQPGHTDCLAVRTGASGSVHVNEVRGAWRAWIDPLPYEGKNGFKKAGEGLSAVKAKGNWPEAKQVMETPREQRTDTDASGEW